MSDKLGSYTTSSYQLSASNGKYTPPSNSQSVSLTERKLLNTDEVRRVKRPHQIITSRDHPAMMYAPDLSQWMFNKMLGCLLYTTRHILTLAKFNGIRVQDLQWVAAHHNEKGHPHIHVVFWNKNQRTMVPFVHPSIPDKIRKQLIRDTFAERIKEYCEAKQRAKEHLSAITDEMIDEFEKYMEHLHPQEYRRLREAFGRITDDELGTSPLDSVVGAMKLSLIHISSCMAAP